MKVIRCHCCACQATTDPLGTASSPLSRHTPTRTHILPCPNSHAPHSPPSSPHLPPLPLLPAYPPTRPTHPPGCRSAASKLRLWSVPPLKFCISAPPPKLQFRAVSNTYLVKNPTAPRPPPIFLFSFLTRLACLSLDKNMLSQLIVDYRMGSVKWFCLLTHIAGNSRRAEPIRGWDGHSGDHDHVSDFYLPFPFSFHLGHPDNYDLCGSLGIKIKYPIYPSCVFSFHCLLRFNLGTPVCIWCCGKTDSSSKDKVEIFQATEGISNLSCFLWGIERIAM